MSPAHPRVGPEALTGIEGEHEAFDHRLREMLLESLPEAFGQTAAHFIVALRLDEQAGHFDDDLRPESKLHHVGRKKDCHRVLALEAKLGDALDCFDDALEDLIELALSGLREAPNFDHWHELLLSLFRYFDLLDVLRPSSSHSLEKDMLDCV